jgi:hypothetical protein
LRGQATKPPARFQVTCDGDGIAGHAGSALLVELADRLGLTTALGWRAGRAPTSRHRYGAGRVLRDPAVLLAGGGDCLSDLAALRDQPELFGPVASTPTAWRAGANTDGLLCIDVDGTLLDAHSSKQGAAGTYKGGSGFYPLLAYLDRGDGTSEALAGILRPGNAGSNTAAAHIEVIDLALAQLPTAAHDQPRLVRADSGGATHAFTSHLRERGVRFSVSLPTDERVRAAVLAVAADAWQPAIDAGGQPRPGAEVAELHTLELVGWPPGPGRSADARIPTRAPSSPLPTPTGTASRCSSPTSPTPTSPPWSCGIAAAPVSRTASAPARPPACATSPCPVAPQLGVAGAGAGRPRPALLDPGPAAGHQHHSSPGTDRPQRRGVHQNGSTPPTADTCPPTPHQQRPPQPLTASTTPTSPTTVDPG